MMPKYSRSVTSFRGFGRAAQGCAPARVHGILRGKIGERSPNFQLLQCDTVSRA